MARLAIVWRRGLIVRAFALAAIVGAGVPGSATQLGNSSIEAPPIVVRAAETTPARTPEVLVAGRLYRFLVTGTFQYVSEGTTFTADAECKYGPPDRQGQFSGEGAVPDKQDHLDLYINFEQQAWTPYHPPARSPMLGGSCADDNDHTYYLDYRPLLTGRAYLHINKSAEATDTVNDGPQDTLFVRVICEVSHPQVVPNAAINDPNSEIASGVPGCPHGQQFTNARYQCSKNRAEGFKDENRVLGILQSAALTVDSRSNEYDPVLLNESRSQSRGYSTPTAGYYANSEFYKQSGHWGLSTCNVAGIGVPYRIIVSGRYKYDQSQPPGFAEADAECTTGYMRSDNLVRDHRDQPVQKADPPKGSVVAKAIDDAPRTASEVTARTERGVIDTKVAFGLAQADPVTDPVTWNAQYIPHYYQYFFDTLRSKSLAGPSETRNSTEDLMPATRDYFEYVYASNSTQGKIAAKHITPEEAGEFSNNSSDWRPDRYDYWVTQTTSPGAQPSSRYEDPFDLRLSYGSAARRYVDWRPLHNVNGALQPYTQGPCSPDNIYYFDIDWSRPQDLPITAGAPIHFLTNDILRYQEWDNCGSLTIRVTPDGFTNQYQEPPPLPDYNFDCLSPITAVPDRRFHWVGSTNRELVKIRDLRVDDHNLANLQNSHAYYFDPPNILVNASNFDIKNGNPVSTTVSFQNFGVGPHSITASLDTDGNYCGNVVTLPHGKITTNPSSTTIASPSNPFFWFQFTLPLASQSASITASVGEDDCDRQGKQRLFDSHPTCLGDPSTIPTRVQQRGKACTAPFESFNVKLHAGMFNQSIAGRPTGWAERCDPNGYCTIPYFCRVAPSTMRGNIVVRVQG